MSSGWFRSNWGLLVLAWFVSFGVPVRAQEDRRWPQLKEVIVVSKTHFDIGYTDLASRVVDRYRTTMADQALKLVDESRDLPPDQKFSWTLAGWPMAQILWPGQTPQRRERFLAAMREGRMVPQALAFTTHTESLDLEDLVRGYRFSVEMARLAGKPLPTAAKMTDVTSHTRVTSTILAHAGVRFFHLGCNEGCSHPDVPLLYWWEGPDGSRVLTMCSSAYGSSLSPPRDWPHKAWLYMWMTGDNHGPPSTEEVNALFARARQELPGVRVRFGQMSDFAEAILREKPELPVVRGDMPDTWIHGIGSMPIETQLAHTTRPRIAALESLDTLLGIWGVPRSSAANVVRDAYENTLLFGEHTWGPDVGRYTGYTYGEQWKRKLAAGDYRFLLEGFAQKRAYAHKAAESVEPAIAERMAALAKAVNVDGRRVVVFNPLPWERNGVVDVSWAGDIQALTDVASGEVVPTAVKDGRLRFVAKNLPPMGYRTYSASQRQSPKLVSAVAKTQIIENELFRVTLDPTRCGIRSIVHKKTGRELVNTRSPFALGQYLYERFDAGQNARFTAANAHGSSFQTFAATAIRCCFVDTSTGSDAPAMFPSNGCLKRHPLRSAGSFGRVPPLHCYYGTLRLPAARLAALRFLRLAIPPLRPICSHRPGRAAGGTGSWYSGSRAGHVSGNGRVSKVPERPSCPCALFLDPGRTEMRQALAAPRRGPRLCQQRWHPRAKISGLDRTASGLAVYASQWRSPATTQDSLPAAG